MLRKIVGVALMALVLMTSTAFAQYREDAVLVTIDAGSTLVKSAYSGDTVSGTAAGFTIEKVIAGGKFSVGGSLAWLKADETTELEPGETGTVTYSSTPFRMTGRWNFLNGRFAANIGLGLGIHTSTQKLFEGTSDEVSQSTNGFNIGIPITVSYFLDPDFYLTAIYAPTWMDGLFVEDDMAHAVMFGLGFQWGAEDK